MRYALLLLAACSGSGSVADGGNELRYQFRDAGDGWYVELDVKVANGNSTEVKAACQLADGRLVDVTPAEAGTSFKASPFLLNPLRAKPTRCEITLRAAAIGRPSQMIAQFCVGDPTAPGLCPPNRNVPETGPTGVRVQLISVKGEDADELGFPAHLTVRYRATASRDMVQGAYLVRTTTCPGRRTDETWHHELENLATGESFDAGQNTYKLGRPPRGTRCETRFGYARRVDGDVTPIATFCHVDETIKPGPC